MFNIYDVKGHCFVTFYKCIPLYLSLFGETVGDGQRIQMILRKNFDEFLLNKFNKITTRFTHENLFLFIIK